MARVGNNEVDKYRKESGERRGSGFGGDDQPKPDFLESAGKFTSVCVAIHHTRSKVGKWGVAFVFMTVDTKSPEFIAYEAWNADQVHRVIVDGFGWDKGYENALPDDLMDRNFNPEADIFTEMWEIATCRDIAKGGKWLPSVSKKRSPYVTLTTEMEEYDGKSRAKCKYIDRNREIGSDGPYYIADFRDKYLKAAGDDGPMKPAKAWYQGWYASRVRKGAEAAPAGRASGGGGGGGSRDRHNEDDDLPF